MTARDPVLPLLFPVSASSVRMTARDPVLPLLFPPGASVEAHSLSAAAAVNGVRGTVAGLQGERVVVRFPAPHGEKALKAANLKLISTSSTPGGPSESAPPA